MGQQVSLSRRDPGAPGAVEPRCPHFGVCGGCSLQDVDPAEQVRAKQATLEQNLADIGGVTPQTWFEPLTGPAWNYRRKARLSVRYVFKKERVLVGFRERGGRYVTDMSECHVLDKRVADRLPELSELIASLASYRRIPQVEVACGDEVASLVFRHLDPMPEADAQKLHNFARASGLAVFLQPAGPDSVRALEPAEIELSYALPAHGLDICFQPSDFIQVNADINRQMADRAVALLEPRPGERVLDLFCGLGNFTLPLAKQGAETVGVEGDAGLVERARKNAARNAVETASYHRADLTLDPGQVKWLREPFDKVLVDPPRSGALEMLPHVAASGAGRVLYVSCDPGSLARDAGVLVHEHGFTLRGAGVADMFPHTGHVESMALFEREP